MSDIHGFITVLTITVVLLFFLLLIAMMIIVDHKAKIPGTLVVDPFSFTGTRMDHPLAAFFTGTFLFVIISVLLFEVTATIATKTGLLAEKENPSLVKFLSRQRDTESMRHFHNVPEQELALMGKRPICFQCHGDYPHSKEPMIRTLMNMHTQFIGCLTCHADKDLLDEKSYKFKWLNYSGIEVTGQPFGTDVNPETGLLAETDDYYSKIVVYATQDDEEKLLEITEDSKQGREFLAVKDQLSDTDKELVKKTFHKTVMPKGRFCTRCHVEKSKSFIPFEELGFSDQRVFDLTNLNIAGLVQKYRKFYLPKLLNSGYSPTDVNTLVGSEDKSAIGKVGTTDDTFSWWKKNFDTEENEEKAAEEATIDKE